MYICTLKGNNYTKWKPILSEILFLETRAILRCCFWTSNSRCHKSTTAIQFNIRVFQ